MLVVDGTLGEVVERSLQVHVIRLRRPWEKSCDGGRTWKLASVPEPIADSLGDHPTAIYRRRFNQPTGLGESSCLSLRITGWEGTLESVTINAAHLETGETTIDAVITELVERHNQITVTLLRTETEGARLSGEVSLAIED